MSNERTQGRITVWYQANTFTGSWYDADSALFVQQFYEYYMGFPASVEYRAP